MLDAIALDGVEETATLDALATTLAALDEGIAEDADEATDEETPAPSVYSSTKLSIVTLAELSVRSAINELPVPTAGVMVTCWPAVKLFATTSYTFEFAP